MVKNVLLPFILLALPASAQHLSESLIQSCQQSLKRYSGDSLEVPFEVKTTVSEVIDGRLVTRPKMGQQWLQLSSRHVREHDTSGDIQVKGLKQFGKHYDEISDTDANFFTLYEVLSWLAKNLDKVKDVRQEKTEIVVSMPPSTDCQSSSSSHWDQSAVTACGEYHVTFDRQSLIPLRAVFVATSMPVKLHRRVLEKFTLTQTFQQVALGSGEPFLIPARVTSEFTYADNKVLVESEFNPAPEAKVKWKK
jgi:hypothetical protein